MIRIASGDTHTSMRVLFLDQPRRFPEGATRMSHAQLSHPHVGRRVLTMVIIVAMATASGSLGAQWFKVPSPRAPRTAAGVVDLAAATPRLANGKPDLSGVWMTGEPLCVIRGTAPISELLKMN